MVRKSKRDILSPTERKYREKIAKRKTTRACHNWYCNLDAEEWLYFVDRKDTVRNGMNYWSTRTGLMWGQTISYNLSLKNIGCTQLHAE